MILDHILDILKLMGFRIAFFLAIRVTIATIEFFVGKIKKFFCSKYKDPDENSSLTGTNFYNSFERANSYLPSTRFNQNKIDVVDSSDWNDFNNDYFYHYTSLYCANQILQSRRIIASLPKWKSFGKNVYFTKCKPDSNDYQIVTNNYIHYSMAYLSNIQCAFAFHKNHLILNKVKELVLAHIS